MSAAIELGAVSMGPDAAPHLELDVGAVDAEIKIIGFYDSETEELIERARRAAELLSKEYGVSAIVVPSTALLAATPWQRPLLVINGSTVEYELLPTVEEIVREVLARLGLREENPLPLPLLGRRGGGEAEAVATV